MARVNLERREANGEAERARARAAIPRDGAAPTSPPPGGPSPGDGEGR